MTVDETLVAALVTTSLGTAIYANRAPDGTQPPYAVYLRVHSTSPNYLANQVTLTNPHFQVDIYAASASQRATLNTELRNKVLATASLKPVTVMEQDFYEPETKLFRAMQEYSFWFNGS